VKDALEQAAEAEKSCKFSCLSPCKPEFELLLGSGEPQVGAGGSVGGGYGPVSGGTPANYVASIVIGWELYFFCAQPAPPSPPTPPGPALSPGAPWNCTDKYCKSGSVEVTQTSVSDETFLDAEAVKSAKLLLLEVLTDTIAGAATKLPTCPQVQCPKHKITITMSSFTVETVRKTRCFDQRHPTQPFFDAKVYYRIYKYCVMANARASWKICLECSS
jgi:hypothetical protein